MAARRDGCRELLDFLLDWLRQQRTNLCADYAVLLEIVQRIDSTTSGNDILIVESLLLQALHYMVQA
jgi:hypothetical protein